jgi:hypothetical protein
VLGGNRDDPALAVQLEVRVPTGIGFRTGAKVMNRR